MLRVQQAPLSDSFAGVFDCVHPIVRLQLGEQFRLPLAWPPRNRNGHFDIRPPQGKAFLASAARRKYQEGSAGLAPRHAYRRDHTSTQPIGLAVSSRLMAQTGSRIGRIKADAGQYFPGLRSYRRRTSIARWKSRKRLLDSGIDEGLGLTRHFPGSSCCLWLQRSTAPRSLCTRAPHMLPVLSRLCRRSALR